MKFIHECAARWVNLGGSCSLLRQEIAQVGGLRSWGRQKWGELKKAAGNYWL